VEKLRVLGLRLEFLAVLGLLLLLKIVPLKLEVRRDVEVLARFKRSISSDDCDSMLCIELARESGALL
jgi:hypothetical protein